MNNAEKRYMNDNRSMPWSSMTEDQRDCYMLLCDWVSGEHNLHGIVRPAGYGISINVLYACANFSTWDSNGLTRLVLLAHDRCIRVELRPRAPNRIGMMLHKRHTRAGDMFLSHPMMEEHIAMLRQSPSFHFGAPK